MIEKMRRILTELQRAGEEGLTKKQYAINTGQCTEEEYRPEDDYDRFHRNCRMLIEQGHLQSRQRRTEYWYFVPTPSEELDIDAILKAMRENARLLSRKFVGKNAYYESPYARTGEYLNDL